MMKHNNKLKCNIEIIIKLQNNLLLDMLKNGGYNKMNYKIN